MTHLTGTRIGTVVALLSLMAVMGRAYGDPTTAEQRALHRFQHAVNTYAALHRDLERSLPRLQVTDDIEALYEAVDALADRIRETRREARDGDVFDADLGRFLRSRIHTTLRDHRIATVDLLTDILEDVPEADGPMVNERFPWVWAAAVPPCLLKALPDLPEELEYRFAGRDLVLIDTHADLVVDILRNALPPLESRRIWT
ncbi:MAG TPA: hypothetical protein VH701_24580 [Vicinamibacterales bacterium]|jgi:hypothetical protein